ncbi:hypothetical protein [Nonomuraea sp. NPDC052265]|uniref:hypothetical protein n=1 Tax=Nonomuraea sp. NPDC052265 TaxID=3364374 RepID=UPI0037C9A87A
MITMTGCSAGGLVPAPERVRGTVSATSFSPSASVRTVNVLDAPEAVPAAAAGRRIE